MLRVVVRRSRDALKSLTLFRLRFSTRSELDFILNAASACHTFTERAEWLIRLFTWLRVSNQNLNQPTSNAGHIIAGSPSQPPAYPVQFERRLDPRRLPSVRLKYILTILERNPEWKKQVRRILIQTLGEISAVDLFSEVGLHQQIGFLQELVERIFVKVLPDAPLHDDLATLITRLFPERDDVLWLEALDVETLQRLITLLTADESLGPWQKIRSHIEDALTYLVIQLRAQGLSPEIRHRLAHERLSDLPFHNLSVLASRFLEDSSQQNVADHQADPRLELNALLSQCRENIEQVYSHLDEHGVSVSLVYRLERMRRQIDRARVLMDLLTAKNKQAEFIRLFLSRLVHDVHERSGIRSFIRQNMDLLTVKVVQRNSEIGEHYITRNREEYFDMFRRACGGGALTALTVYIKFLVSALGLSPFLTGVLASFNYGLSFVSMQLLGFTLATKQPASTAPALAAKLKNTGNSFAQVSEEIINLLRTQVVAVAGNLLMVAPVAFLTAFLYHRATGSPILSAEKSMAALKDIDILGPTALFAGFTGILLFTSSLCAGWVENWFVYRKIRSRIALNDKFRFVFGETNSRFAAEFFNRNIAGFAGNLSLGIMLGLVPEILHFLGVPLQARHITLSTGSAFVALESLGFATIEPTFYLRMIIGLFSVATLNVSVSFFLAFLLATRATRIRGAQRWSIFKEVLHMINERPGLLFMAPNSTNEKKPLH